MGARLNRLLARRPSQGDDDLGDWRARAGEAEAAGRVGEAIVAWTTVNRLHPTPEVEEHLVQLRCDLALSQPAGAPSEPWPPEYDDPFPDVEGRAPEVEADQLTSEVLGGAIRHHGCLLVRHLVAPERGDAMRATIDQVFTGRRDHLAGVPAADTTPWYVPCAAWDAFTPDKARNARRYTDVSGSAMRACDSPRAIFQITDALEGSPVLPAIAAYLGERPVLSANKTMLRRVPPDATPSWHQDGSFMGKQTRTVNVWVALSDCGQGREAPGLAVVPRRLDESLRGEVSDGDIILTPEQFADATDGVGVIRPTFAPGDALLFDDLLVHANGGGEPGLTRPRYAVEAWMFAPTSLPTDYLPLSVG